MTKYVVTVEAELETPAYNADNAESKFRTKLSSEIAWAMASGDNSVYFEPIAIEDVEVEVMNVQLTNGDLDEVIQERDDYPEFFVEGHATFVMDVKDPMVGIDELDDYLQEVIPEGVDRLELFTPTVEEFY